MPNPTVPQGDSDDLPTGWLAYTLTTDPEHPSRVRTDAGRAGTVVSWTEGNAIVFVHYDDGGVEPVDEDRLTFIEADDSTALDLITRALSGVEWSADTLDAIADAVRLTGRHIADADDGPDHPDWQAYWRRTARHIAEDQP